MTEPPNRASASAPGPARERRRARLLRFVPVVAWALVILGFSSIPDVGSRLPPVLDFRGSTVLGHVVVYSVFGALLGFATRRFWPTVLIVSAFGALDESYQGFVPGRTPSVVDWLVDTVSGALGAASALHFSRRGRVRE
jgi:VanZ family protein